MCSTHGRFVLLNRDGVINRRISGGDVTSWKQFEFLPGALDGLCLLAQRGYIALVISNQACVGEGRLPAQELGSMTRRFMNEVVAAGGDIGGAYYCLHCPEDDCDCLTPRPGLLLRAQRDHHFDFAETFVVGDSVRDLEAAQRVGAPAVLISQMAEPRSAPRVRSAPVVHGIYEAAEFILASALAQAGALSLRDPAGRMQR
jgi:D-glycero-D-manno-heptose 1,7-bisphosphate phosphatase